MILHRLSLAAILGISLSSSLFATESLSEAFQNGKVKGELKAWYWDRKNTLVNNKANVTNLALELGYKTGYFYGLYAGATFQANSTPWISEKAKKLYVKEQYASGGVLSEAYLGYNISKTDIKIGRQYINTPIISGNYARIFKESFQGITLQSKDIENTLVYAGYVDRFHGRTSAIHDPKDIGNAPQFKDSITLAGATDLAHKFDGAWYAGFSNSAIRNLKLSAAYARVNDVEFQANKENDLDIYYTELNYNLPLDGFKLGFDISYRGSNTDFKQYDGDFIGVRVRFGLENGFSGLFAASSVSDKASIVANIGLGGGTYTFLPMRGSSMFAVQAGTDTYKAQLDYDFAKIGLKGLTTSAQYVTAKRKDDIGTNIDYDGYAFLGTYNIPQIKGLNLNVVWTSLDIDNKKTNKESGIDELWVKVGYRF
ncbi:OprD family outer membrane porin [Campylobacter pinnipediorum]|uniref:OprD family outer membrane porin n=1 Tax=Campylobacter pinnipediorum TaxID=1965231 RepID=UPI00084D2D70|nr:OprD family outer membrane porin [Campylobacter pinnipediorum]